MSVSAGAAAAAIAISGALAGCAQPDSLPRPQALGGTEWQLVAIQSMDDAQGTTRTSDPTRFTLRFGEDGRATMQLDCNRASGGYEATPSSDPNSGSLTFGPLAATRALCAPPHLDERVARQLPYVRSFLLKDGRLYLSLMADGGILEWRPGPGAK